MYKSDKSNLWDALNAVFAAYMIVKYPLLGLSESDVVGQMAR